MSIEVRRELGRSGLPLGRRKILEEGQCREFRGVSPENMPKSRFLFLAPRSRMQIRVAKNSSLEIEEMNPNKRTYRVPEADLVVGLVLPAEFGTRISVRVAKEKK